RELLATCDVRAMAHVTGGGIAGNLARVLPAGLGARLELAAWPRSAVFDWLAGLGVAGGEIRRVFNLRLGYLAGGARGDAQRAAEAARRAGHEAFVVGAVERGEGVRLEPAAAPPQ